MVDRKLSTGRNRAVRRTFNRVTLVHTGTKTSCRKRRGERVVGVGRRGVIVHPWNFADTCIPNSDRAMGIHAGAVIDSPKGLRDVFQIIGSEKTNTKIPLPVVDEI